MAGTSASAPSPQDGATPTQHPYDPEDFSDDPIVQELDVYICNEQVGSATQLCLLQHPLRPSWRPYQYDKVKQVRMKPEAKRLEVDMPLDAESRNYNDVIEDYKKVKTITLRSSLVDHKASYAIATVRDGKLLLAPVDYSLMMRPALTYLDVAAQAGKKKGKDDDDDEDEEEDEPKMHAVEVKVQKRETERQAAARLNSYAHLAAKEDEEKFLNLTVRCSAMPCQDGRVRTHALAAKPSIINALACAHVWVSQGRGCAMQAGGPALPCVYRRAPA